MKTAAIIQVRMGSTRLPGKSLEKIADQSLIEHVIDRTKACRLVDTVTIATTDRSEDDVFIPIAKRKGIHLYRGSSEDVLDRYYQAATIERCDVVARITADDPFKDPTIIDRAIHQVVSSQGVDYASNTLDPTYPEGLDIEVFTYRALERAWFEGKKASEREHVTPYIWKHPEIFKLMSIRSEKDLSHLRWTLDYPEDLQFARAVYERLYQGNIFTTEAILDLLRDEPGLSAINAGFQRNSGYLKSVNND